MRTGNGMGTRNARRRWASITLASKLLVVVLMLALGALVGCNKQATVAASTAAVADQAATPGGPRGFDPTTQLVLGTLKLEGTDNAVTPAQAAELLPLWQLIQSGSLQSDAETQAVLKQIESNMTEAQLAAIQAMGLTFEDVRTWMQEQGIEMPTPAAGQDGGPGAFQNLTEEQRAQMRQEFQNMTPEQRATRMAEMGVQRPEGTPGAGGGFRPPEGTPGAGGGGGRPNFGAGGGAQSRMLLSPLIDLLTKRAAE
jgi:hypothetical protein